MRLRELLKEIKDIYPSVKLFEIELIISNVLNIPGIDIYTKPDTEISKSQKKLIYSYLDRVVNNEPLQYVLKEEAFRDLTLLVGPGVLIPRPETEQVVEKALQLLPSRRAKVLDVGTGSGAIALSIAHEAPGSFVVGVDISEDALEYARKNMLKNKISNVEFKYGDLCKGFSDNSFDMIIANLPYVAEEELETLEPNVRDFEPKLALVAEDNGLELMHQLVPQAYNVLLSSGWLLLEIGYEQGQAVTKMLKQAGFVNVDVIPDFNKKDRIAIAQKP